MPDKISEFLAEEEDFDNEKVEQVRKGLAMRSRGKMEAVDDDDDGVTEIENLLSRAKLATTPSSVKLAGTEDPLESRFMELMQQTPQEDIQRGLQAAACLTRENKSSGQLDAGTEQDLRQKMLHIRRKLNATARMNADIVPQRRQRLGSGARQITPVKTAEQNPPPSGSPMMFAR